MRCQLHSSASTEIVHRGVNEDCKSHHPFGINTRNKPSRRFVEPEKTKQPPHRELYSCINNIKKLPLLTGASYLTGYWVYVFMERRQSRSEKPRTWPKQTLGLWLQEQRQGKGGERFWLSWLKDNYNMKKQLVIPPVSGDTARCTFLVDRGP